MSTKCSVAWGDGFHLYNECLEDDCVYLEIDKADVQHNGSVTLRIPNAVWETIRHYGAPDLSLAGKTDAQLRRIVSREVSVRIAGLRKARRELRSDPEGLARKIGMLSFCGFLVYGEVTEPKDKQVERAMAVYRDKRDAQTAVKAQVDKWRRDITPGPFVIKIGKKKGRK